MPKITGSENLFSSFCGLLLSRHCFMRGIAFLDHPLSRVKNSEVITSNDAFIADQHDIKACRKMTALVNTCLFLLVIVSEFLPNNDNIAVAAEPQRSSRIKDISDDDILEALAILLSEEVEREARQNGEFEQFDDLDPEEDLCPSS